MKKSRRRLTWMMLSSSRKLAATRLSVSVDFNDTRRRLTIESSNHIGVKAETPKRPPQKNVGKSTKLARADPYSNQPMSIG